MLIHHLTFYHHVFTLQSTEMTGLHSTQLSLKTLSCSPGSPGPCGAAHSASKCCDYRPCSASFCYFQNHKEVLSLPQPQFIILPPTHFTIAIVVCFVFFLLEMCLLFPQETLACSIAQFLALNLRYHFPRKIYNLHLDSRENSLPPFPPHFLSTTFQISISSSEFNTVRNNLQRNRLWPVP